MTIKEIRDFTGMSQSEFSREFGIPIRTISAWETGSRKPPQYVIRLIERIVLLENMWKRE